MGGEALRIKYVISILILLLLVGAVEATVTQYNLTDGSYAIIIFNGTGSTTWVAPSYASTIEYLIVAGGGGGGAFNWTGSLSGGGGGAGGVLNASGYTLNPSSTYNIIVGAGGVGGYIIPSTSGQNSSFGNATVNISAAGGGSGAGSFISPNVVYLPGSGGSGGGNSSNASTTGFGGTGITGQGYKGGSSYYRAPFMDEQYGGGGGGGAEAIGSNGSAVVGGNGGIGRQNAITGVLTYYGGGGGGSVTHWGGSLGAGGSGGGGSGTRYGYIVWGGYDWSHNLTGVADPLANGTNGLGGGGGGAADQTIGGNGGSGVVILRYLIPALPISNFTSNITGGSPPLVVQFNDTSTNSPIGWAWFFGDEPFTQTWNQINSSAGWTPRDYSESVVLPDGSIVLMGGLDSIGTRLSDVWRSTNNGVTWTQMNASTGWSGGKARFASAVTQNGNILVMGGDTNSGQRNDTWMSTDKGATWTQMNASCGWGVRFGNTAVTAPDGSILLMGGSGDSYYNDTWRSIDNGSTWTLMNASCGWQATWGSQAVTLADGSVIIMGGQASNSVWRTTNNGATWTQMTASAGWSARRDFDAVASPDGSVILMGGDSYPANRGMWRSTDNGATWSLVQYPGFINSGIDGPSLVSLPDGSIVEMGGYIAGYTDDVWRMQPVGSSIQDPIHTYPDFGGYNVSLQIYNSVGYNLTQKLDYINVFDPINASFTSTSNVGVQPLTVVFTDTSTGNSTGWNWSFGDGTFDNITQSPSHTYTSVGNYSVFLRAFHSYDANTTPNPYYINVTYGPTAVFNATPNPAVIGTTIAFVDMSTNGATTWNWTFGDGSVSTSRNITHVYSTIGVFNVTLNVTHLNGYSNYSLDVTIYPAAPVANFSVDHNIGSNPLTVLFTDTSGSGVVSWYWTFGDGGTDTVQNPSHTYTSLGTYYPQLTITTSVGTNVSQPVAIYVVNSAIPMVNFVGLPVSGSSPLSVQFTDLSAALNPLTGWNWSFGDGSYSNAQNPSHIYVTNGQYTVTLISASGAFSNYTTKVGYINAGVISSTVYPNFMANITYVANYPAAVAFTDYSVCSPACTNWVWDFNNDGSVDSMEKNPTYVYNYPGNYSPKLIVSNGMNSGTKIRNLYIVIGPILVQPTIPQPSGLWHPGYQVNGSDVFAFKGDANIDLANSTYLKYWLQNFTTTGNFSVYGFVTGIMAPIMHVFGFWIFLIIWGLYLFAVWVRSQDVTMPLIIGILSIGTFGLLFPKEALPVIIIMFVICGAIIITKVLKE